MVRATMKIYERDLGKLTFLAEGAFGKVYRTGYRLNGDPLALAYKQFIVSVPDQARSAKAAVTFRDGLNQADQTDLDEYTTWPRALVHDRAGICGLLMPLIPPEYFCRQKDYKTGKLELKPRKISWLAASDNQRAAAQVSLDAGLTERLVLLAQLVYSIGRLHRHGWAYGDLSFNNACFALDPPRLMLLDCDGAAPLSDLNRDLHSSPFWDPPEHPLKPQPGQVLSVLDDRSDVYKLGLAILRCLTPGRGAMSARDTRRLGSELDPGGHQIVARALADAPGDRPSAKEICEYLVQVVAGRVAVPEVTLARLTSPLLVRGQDARLEWQISGADEIEIISGNGLSVLVDPTRHPTGYAFRPAASGKVRIEARNRYGSVSVDLGDLALFELPPFDARVVLPRPRIPALEAFAPRSLDAMLAGRPRIAAGGEVFSMPSFTAPEFISGLMPSTQTGISLPNPTRVAGEPFGDVTQILIEEGSTTASNLRDQIWSHVEAAVWARVQASMQASP